MLSASLARLCCDKQNRQVGKTKETITDGRVHVQKGNPYKQVDGPLKVGPLKMGSPISSPLQYDYLGSVLKSNSVPIEVIPIEFIDPMSELARWSAWKSPTVRIGGPTAKLDVRWGGGSRELPLSGCPKPALMPLFITPLIAWPKCIWEGRPIFDGGLILPFIPCI